MTLSKSVFHLMIYVINVDQMNEWRWISYHHIGYDENIEPEKCQMLTFHTWTDDQDKNVHYLLNCTALKSLETLDQKLIMKSQILLVALTVHQLIAATHIQHSLHYVQFSSSHSYRYYLSLPKYQWESKLYTASIHHFSELFFCSLFTTRCDIILKSSLTHFIFLNIVCHFG